jgi:AraC family transcriptional activator of mtrCDE
MSDALSDVMQRIRLKSCVYFQRDFHSPWSMKIEGTGYAQFHVITRGSCVAVIDGQSRECSTGDVLLFPHGLSHVLADHPDSKPLPGAEVMKSFDGDSPCFAEGGSPTRIICGHFEYRTDIHHPLIDDLPGLVHVKTMEILGENSNMAVLPLIMRELSTRKPGQSLIVERYAEILLIHTLRIHYAETKHPTGFYAALADERLERAISMIHRDFSSPIGLAELADSAAMSRSAFAQKFKHKVRISPIEYLLKWRMLVAEDLLKTTELPVIRVAEKVGYESDISFARAFKREYGVTPSSFRKWQVE